METKIEKMRNIKEKVEEGAFGFMICKWGRGDGTHENVITRIENSGEAWGVTDIYSILAQRWLKPSGNCTNIGDVDTYFVDFEDALHIVENIIE